eukprot:gene7054-8415_t
MWYAIDSLHARLEREERRLPMSLSLGTAEELVGLIENAQYQEVLRSDTASTLLPLPSSFGGSSQDDVASAAKKYYDKVRSALSSYLSSAESTTDKADRHLQALAVGVAALYIFLQTNFTGPPMRDVVGAPYELRGAPRGPNMDDWAMQELAADGEDPIGRRVVGGAYASMAAASTEPAVTDAARGQILQGLASEDAPIAVGLGVEAGLGRQVHVAALLEAALMEYMYDCVDAARFEKARGRTRERALLRMEALVEEVQGASLETAAAAQRMRYAFSALKVAGVEFKLSGVLGKRTEHQGESASAPKEAGNVGAGGAVLRNLHVAECGLKAPLTLRFGSGVFQVESKAQLVLTVERAPAGEEAGGWESDEEEMVRKDAAAVEAAPQDAPAVEAPAPSPAAETDSGDSAPVVEGEQPVRREGTGENKLAEFGIKDESNVIEAGPRLDSAEGATTLRSLEQALVLAHCTSIKRSSADDELQGWEMAPYVDAVRSQRCTRPLFSVVCNLLQ